MSGLNFTTDHWYLDDLPGDPDQRNVRRQVNEAAWSQVIPTPTAGPTLIAHSSEVSAELGISDEAVASDQFARVFSGNEVLADMTPSAMNYGGHQFGNWAGQLGDGRAIALTEVTTPNGTHQVLQLKGAGPTPYSRGADGRAVLRSSVREFLCSEAMHHLGVPTTRALSLTLTGDEVVRDMLYDGHPAPEQGAVVCRVAPSFVRFGHFELPASRGEIDLLRQLVDHTIRRHFPHLVTPIPGTVTSVPVPEATGRLDDDVIAAWFRELMERTADLMVDWMRVGFVHGVMNTDNLSILGLTIDYGPYGWLEDFDPGWTPNTTDAGGKRYRYGNQPEIGHWNLSRLGGALASLVDDIAPLQSVVDDYPAQFGNAWDTALASKLGLAPEAIDADARRDLANMLLEILPLVETDMTIFFRTLGDIDVTAIDTTVTDGELLQPLQGAYYTPAELAGDVLTRTADWFRRYVALSATANWTANERRAAMHAVNPKYVLRNYLAQLAIDKADTGSYDMIDELLDLLRHPYDDQPGREELAALRPDWARERVGCSMLSCSS
jgi:uncharacterized protein YdiU (UPF0061 family)